MTDDLRNRIITLTRDLMIIPSDLAHPEEQKRCLQFIRYRLEEIPSVMLFDVEENAHPSLLALPGGVSQPDVLIVLHVDVVEHEREDVFEAKIEEDRIYGPGAGDMKGEVSLCVNLFEDLHREYEDLSLGMLITSDEEIGGEDGVKTIIEKHGVLAGSVLVPDGGSPESVITIEKGILHIHLEAQGEEAHAARPWQGVNALEQLQESMQDIKAHLNGRQGDMPDWPITCTLTGLQTPNQAVNQIPAIASGFMDVRFPPPFTADGLLDEISKLLKDGVKISSVVKDDASHLRPDPLYIECMNEGSEVPVQQVGTEGGSDGRFFSRLGVPVNMSRPWVGNLHREDEWIDIPSMLEFYSLYKTYILKRTGRQ